MADVEDKLMDFYQATERDKLDEMVYIRSNFKDRQ